MDGKPKKSFKELHDQHRAQYWDTQSWRPWSSWSSPVGVGLFYALVVLSTGVYTWLVHHR